MSDRPTLALVTEDRCVSITEGEHWYTDNILHEDRLVAEALTRVGFDSERVSWSDPEVDWSKYRAAVLRTTWDYFGRISEFLEWLDRVTTKTTLVNPEALVRWNLDKHYLLDLDDRGVHTVPSVFIERGEQVDLRALLELHGFEDAVIKPAVSGAARHTYRLNRAELRRSQRLNEMVNAVLLVETMMLQPFQNEIVEHGETTLVVMDGRFTHALRKVPKAGDFRVQDDHGGTVHPYTPTTEEIEFAERAMAGCDPKPLYGRVDLVRDNDGALAVMELELVEPELWFRLNPTATDRLAAALARELL